MSEPDALACAACGWKGEDRDGISVYLSTRDRQDPILKEYLEGSFWQSGWRKDLYLRFQREATKRLHHYTDVTSWNQRLARLLMVPLEILVIARKVHSIEKTGKGAYALR